MSGSLLECFLHYQPRQSEPLKVRHQAVVTGMQRISNPLSWRDQIAPELPSFGTELIASYELRYPGEGVWLQGTYNYRAASMLFSNDITDDDKLILSINTNTSSLNYSRLLSEYLPEAIVAYNAYLVRGFFDDYAYKFHQLHPREVDQLRSREDVDFNGRNNIFSLQPVQFWDQTVCSQALGYGRDEVIRRLTGKVPLVKPLMDGVYVVFSDNPDLTFEEYCAYNDALKPVLGLI